MISVFLSAPYLFLHWSSSLWQPLFRRMDYYDFGLFTGIYIGHTSTRGACQWFHCILDFFLSIADFFCRLSVRRAAIWPSPFSERRLVRWQQSSSSIEIHSPFHLEFHYFWLCLSGSSSPLLKRGRFHHCNTIYYSRGSGIPRLRLWYCYWSPVACHLD